MSPVSMAFFHHFSEEQGHDSLHVDCIINMIRILKYKIYPFVFQKSHIIRFEFDFFFRLKSLSLDLNFTNIS